MRDRLYEIADVEELFRALSARNRWKRIPSGVLRRLFDNASAAPMFPTNAPLNWSNPTIQLLQRVAEISEDFNAVEEKWIPFSRQDDPKEALSMIAASFEDMGYQLVDEARILDNGKGTRNFPNRYKSAVREAMQFTGLPEPLVLLGTADLAYQSALVCDPFILSCYVSLAGLYMLYESGRAWIIEACELFDRAEEKLLYKADNDLSSVNQVLKTNHDGFLSAVRKDIDLIKTQVGMSVTLRKEVPETRSNNIQRQHLYEISEGLLGDPSPTMVRKQVLCKKCKKMVIPTFHKCCPDCGEFL